jgi:hypothetical protein
VQLCFKLRKFNINVMEWTLSVNTFIVIILVSMRASMPNQYSIEKGIHTRSYEQKGIENKFANSYVDNVEIYSKQSYMFIVCHYCCTKSISPNSTSNVYIQ